MPSQPVRIPQDVCVVLDRIAAKQGLTRQEALIRAIGFLAVIEDLRARGEWVGGTPDRENLTTVIVPPV